MLSPFFLYDSILIKIPLDCNRFHFEIHYNHSLLDKTHFLYDFVVICRTILEMFIVLIVIFRYNIGEEWFYVMLSYRFKDESKF